MASVLSVHCTPETPTSKEEKQVIANTAAQIIIMNWSLTADT